MKTVALAGLAIGLAAVPTIVHASFLGSTVLGEYSTDLSQPAWCSATSIVGPGVEFECPGPFRVDVSDRQILYTLSGFSEFGDSPFDGFVVSVIAGNVPGIIEVEIESTTLEGLTPSRIAFDPQTISINFSALRMPDQFMSTILNVEFRRAPEPGTLALLCLGLAGLGLSRRRGVSDISSHTEPGPRTK